MKRQPHSATTLKKWRGEESPSVLRRRGCQIFRIKYYPSCRVKNPLLIFLNRYEEMSKRVLIFS
ncbi:MAG: hypothetical protein EWV48_06290 [Microcystis aeruginosa Ma_QC_C_20070823_S13]|nr:MAG: hypothetical protein EWV56_17780 [Microcystis aeruginosa Ma_QC_C_20070823_S13D]TRU64220.1 MAG: hypothetical protein EWV48_06290 [Microcystis aeruginosa Ma_QC_C_20070823_S13]